MQVSFTLSFDTDQWICSGTQIQLEAATLEDLDEKIKDFLQKKYKKGVFNVAMQFDFDSFPIWMRQYMPHYFNREITYNL